MKRSRREKNSWRYELVYYCCRWSCNANNRQRCWTNRLFCNKSCFRIIYKATPSFLSYHHLRINRASEKHPKKYKFKQQICEDIFSFNKLFILWHWDSNWFSKSNQKLFEAVSSSRNRRGNGDGGRLVFWSHLGRDLRKSEMKQRELLLSLFRYLACKS